jgi:uncharacterized membrane protein
MDGFIYPHPKNPEKLPQRWSGTRAICGLIFTHHKGIIVMSKKRNKSNQNKSTTNKQDKIEAKKAVVLGTEKRSRLPVLIGIVGAVLIVGAAVMYANLSVGNPSAIASAPAAAGSTSISFPASLFEDGKARHFEHVDGKHTIRYFVLKSSDGIVRAAFDACDVCWPAGKGYYQEGDSMVCRNCGRKFASVLVNEVKGGCNPAPLNRTLENGKLVIQIKDILNGKQYFNFEKKV